MKLDPPKNNNYAAVVVAIHTLVDLEGLDNLIGVPVVGHQALTTKGVVAGDLRIAFTAETQLSEDYCAINSLYRDATLNKDPEEKGYLEKNRRVRALKLRGHVSNALLMPLHSLSYTGADISQLSPGDTFDSLNGHEVCRKYEIPVKQQRYPGRTKVEKAFKRVDEKLFPEHLETDQYGRNKHLLSKEREVIVTQKLHGTSWRGGHVPVRQEPKWHHRLRKALGFHVPDRYTYDVIFGSRKVIKDPNNPNQNHFYKDDIWTDYGKKIAELIPEGFIVYGELVGWTPEGAALQKNYTYHLAPGEAELYIYRVAFINSTGTLGDLSWDGVKDFCRARGLKWVPELFRFSGESHRDWDSDLFDRQVQSLLDQRYVDIHQYCPAVDAPLPLSDPKSVDEGLCLRQDGLVPLVLKAKSPKFLEHETKLLDKGEVDMESAA